MTEKEEIKLYNDTVIVNFYPKSHRYKLVELDGKEQNKWLKSPSGVVSKLDKSAPLMAWAVNMFYDKFKELTEDGHNFTKDDLESILNVAKEAYREKKKEAGNIGSVVHDYAQRHNRIKIQEAEGFDELSEEDQERAVQSSKGLDKWIKEIGAKSLESEFLVYSKKEKFVGRCDELVEIDGKKYIIDYKTSKGIYSDQIYQVASYLKAKEEETGDRIDGAMLVHLIKEDIEDLDGCVIKKAGDFGVIELSRSDLVKAYKVFKALLVVAETDPEIEKIIKEKYITN